MSKTTVPTPFHRDWQRIRERIAAARHVVDLGCGPTPVEGATCGVDAFLGVEQRGLGWSPRIDPDALAARGIEFVESRIDVELPFADKQFDFAYSHHVFEHVDHPVVACREMMRIAKAGVIVTPSVFAEIAFGRPYHKWLVMRGDRSLHFFEKTEWDYGPFGVPLGSHPDGGLLLTEQTGPFDAVLDDGGWYEGSEDFGALRERLQHHYRARSPVFDLVFHWEDSFDCHVVRREPGAGDSPLPPWMPGMPA